MVLLDASSTASDTITITGLGTVGGGLIALAIKYFWDNSKKSKANDEEVESNETKHALMEQRIKQLEEDKTALKNAIERDLIGLKNSKNNLRKKFEEDMKEATSLIHKRIDKTQDEMKNYAQKIDAEMSLIKRDVGDIKVGQAEILAKLNIIIQKK